MILKFGIGIVKSIRYVVSLIFIYSLKDQCQFSVLFEKVKLNKNVI